MTRRKSPSAIERLNAVMPDAAPAAAASIESGSPEPPVATSIEASPPAPASPPPEEAPAAPTAPEPVAPTTPEPPATIGEARRTFRFAASTVWRRRLRPIGDEVELNEAEHALFYAARIVTEPW